MSSVALGLLALAPWTAHAGSMDVALERLVEDPSCRTPEGQIVPGAATCQADEVAFKRLVNQYAMAIAPTAMYPAHTTGYGGFEIAIEGAFTQIDSSQDYWQRGTRGGSDPSSGQAATTNASPASLMQMYSLRLRKGFGLGFEVGSQFGFLVDTSVVAGGVDVRWAVLENLGVLPDLAFGGAVRTLTGTPQIQLTVPTVEAVLSKRFTLFGSGRLTPWVGFQYLFLIGNSGAIDFTPATDAQQYCNYIGNNQAGGPAQPPGTAGRDGMPVCQGGVPTDFANTHVFTPVRLERRRLFAGANYQYEILQVGAQVSFDLGSPADAQNDEADRRDLANQPSQLVFALQLGAVF
ncbi:MAG TPA: hypothetical protein VLC09_22165 [Polyangiaceae bacterium]|nr:hypothetical protein [Polyangiaceae bacterium]